MTCSQKEESETKLIQRLTERRRGDIYDVIERVLRAEAREVGREGEVERMLLNVGLARALEDMSRGDDSYINHNIGDQVIEVCERVGLPIGQVSTVPPEHRARGSAPPFKDRAPRLELTAG